MLSGPAGSEVTVAVSRLVDGVPSSVHATMTRDVYIESIGGVVTEVLCLLYISSSKVAV